MNKFGIGLIAGGILLLGAALTGYFVVTKKAEKKLEEMIQNGKIQTPTEMDTTIEPV